MDWIKKSSEFDRWVKAKKSKGMPITERGKNGQVTYVNEVTYELKNLKGVTGPELNVIRELYGIRANEQEGYKYKNYRLTEKSGPALAKQGKGITQKELMAMALSDSEFEEYLA